MALGGKKKSFSEMSTPERIGVAVAIGGSLVAVAVAERDISLRAPEELRGGKLLWRLACLNALGVRFYYWFGRRPAAADAET